MSQKTGASPRIGVVLCVAEFVLFLVQRQVRIPFLAGGAGRMPLEEGIQGGQQQPSEASGSAVPVLMPTQCSTTNPFRFSIST